MAPGALAYVFWHRPGRGADRAAYELAQAAFHARIGVPSACFRLDALPFGERDGYEDWYLVDGWAGLGELNETAVDAVHRPSHDAAAALVGAGWAGVYCCVRGPAEIPEGARWLEKPLGEPSGDFIAALEAVTVWRRQLVLGPAPEFSIASSAAEAGRAHVDALAAEGDALADQ